eukprot:394869-Prorocentrum_minimum.AAC.3
MTPGHRYLQLKITKGRAFTAHLAPGFSERVTTIGLLFENLPLSLQVAIVLPQHPDPVHQS